VDWHWQRHSDSPEPWYLFPSTLPNVKNEFILSRCRVQEEEDLTKFLHERGIHSLRSAQVAEISLHASLQGILWGRTQLPNASHQVQIEKVRTLINLQVGQNRDVSKSKGTVGFQHAESHSSLASKLWMEVLLG